MVSFLAVGDWGRRGCAEQRAVAQGMAHVARRLRTQFVVSTGDNFYDDGVAGVTDAHWQESFETVYADAALRTPWYSVLGNHDYRGSVEAQVAYTGRSDRWRLPARYYTLRRPVGARRRVQLFCLDTTPFLRVYRPGGREHTPGVAGQDPEAQLRWLYDALRASTAAWKIVVGHHPLRSGSPFHGEAPEWRDRLSPVLHAGGADVYLSGHEHDLQHLVDENGLHHVVSGAGSECRTTGACAVTRFSQGALGFASFTVSARRLRLRFHGADGRMLYRARLTKPREGVAPLCASTAAPESFAERLRQLVAKRMRAGLVRRFKAEGERVLLAAGAWRGSVRKAEAVWFPERLLGAARTNACLPAP